MDEKELLRLLEGGKLKENIDANPEAVRAVLDRVLLVPKYLPETDQLLAASPAQCLQRVWGLQHAKDPKLRARVAQCLGHAVAWAGDAAARSEQCLLELARDKSAQVRACAVKSLCVEQAGDINNRGLVKECLHAACTDASNAVRLQAVLGCPMVPNLLPDGSFSALASPLMQVRFDPDSSVRAAWYASMAKRMPDPAATQEVLRCGWSDKCPAVNEACTEMAFIWFTDMGMVAMLEGLAGGGILGTSLRAAEAEAVLCIKHLVKKDSGLKKQCLELLRSSNLMEGADAFAGFPSEAEALVCRVVAGSLSAKELDDVDPRKVLDRLEQLVAKAWQPAEKVDFWEAKQLLLLFQALDVRDEVLRAKLTELCVAFAGADRAAEDPDARAAYTFPARAEKQRWLGIGEGVTWQHQPSFLEVAIGLCPPARVVEIVSEKVDPLTGPGALCGQLVEQLGSHHATARSVARLRAEVADLDAKRMYHPDKQLSEPQQAELDETQVRLDQAEAALLEAETDVEELLPKVQQGWEHVLVVSAALLEQVAKAKDAGSSMELQGMLPHVILPALKWIRQLEGLGFAQATALRCLGLYCLRFPDTIADKLGVFMDRYTAALPTALQGNEDSLQQVAVAIACMSDMELSREQQQAQQLGPKTSLTVSCLPSIVRADRVPAWLQRLAVEVGGAHLLRTSQPDATKAGLLALWLQRLFADRVEPEERHLLYQLAGAVAKHGGSLLVDAFRLTMPRHPRAADLCKMLVPQVPAASLGQLVWVLGAERDAACRKQVEDSLSLLLATCGCVEDRPADWPAMKAWFGSRSPNLDILVKRIDPEPLKMLAAPEAGAIESPEAAPFAPVVPVAAPVPLGSVDAPLALLAARQARTAALADLRGDLKVLG